MIHHTTRQFWNGYHRLPLAVRDHADRNYVLLKANPAHPSLQFKRLTKDLLSIRIGLDYRALATKVDDTVLWFWIGHHKEYDLLIKQ